MKLQKARAQDLGGAINGEQSDTAAIRMAHETEKGGKAQGTGQCQGGDCLLPRLQRFRDDMDQGQDAGSDAEVLSEAREDLSQVRQSLTMPAAEVLGGYK